MNNRSTMYRLIIEGSYCAAKTYMSCIDFSSVLANTVRMAEIGRQCFKREDGITVSITFNETHQILHTRLEQQSVILEISSHKDFDKDQVVKAFKMFFKPKHLFLGKVTMTETR